MERRSFLGREWALVFAGKSKPLHRPLLQNQGPNACLVLTSISLQYRGQEAILLEMSDVVRGMKL